jgi:hypothetical protein
MHDLVALQHPACGHCLMFVENHHFTIMLTGKSWLHCGSLILVSALSAVLLIVDLDGLSQTLFYLG